MIFIDYAYLDFGRRRAEPAWASLPLVVPVGRGTGVFGKANLMKEKARHRCGLMSGLLR